MVKFKSKKKKDKNKIVDNAQRHTYLQIHDKKSLQSSKLFGIKLYQLCTQGTHRLSSNA